VPKKNHQKIIERYKQLLEVLQGLASVLNPEQLMEEIVKAATELCNVEAAWFMLSDLSNQVLRIETTTLPNSPQDRGLIIPLESSLEGWVLMNQKPVMINNSSLYEHTYGKITSVIDLEIKSILSLPVTTNDRQIGVLEVVNQKTGQFSQLDQEILVSFANQVAIYIVNTHLFLQSDLVAELVHELRTPLASLNTAIQLLQRSDLPDNKRERISDMISTEFERLSDLTTSFMEYARLESGRVKFQTSRFDFYQLLSETVDVMQMQADGKGIKITLHNPGIPMPLIADRDKIKQVILNLLNNAIIYNRPQGNVNITTQFTPTDLTFSINDDGQGIPVNYIPRLFERFFRAPDTENLSTGTGLGLTICKQIVDAHEGKIKVTSVVGEGSTFTVRLPVTREE
jgi:signal transduction histidine kinase